MNATPARSLGLPVVIAFGLIACILYGLAAGLRSDIGILLPALVEHTGLTYQDVSLCIAVMNLVFGATQPAFGMVAARTSNRHVLFTGIGLIAAGLVGMALSHAFVTLLLSLGIVFGAGAGALAFGLILSSAMRRVGPERAMLISGMLNAAAGLGSFTLSPTLQGLLAEGVPHAMFVLLMPTVLLIPIAVAVTSADPKRARTRPGVGALAPSNNQVAERPDAQGETRGLFHRAFRDRTFLLLVAGFSTCGFHMVLIESHLFSQYVSYGIDAANASWAFSLYGIATIFGALLSGWLSTKVPKGKLLVFYYGFRAVWTVAFLLFFPKNLFGALLFSIGLGMTGDATVSPTSGIVHVRYSLTDAATLIGVLFFCHQIGGFLSAWLGGALLDATGSYAALWILDAGLCALASLASSRIDPGKRTGVDA